MKQKNWQRHEPAPQKLHQLIGWGFNTKNKKKAVPKHLTRRRNPGGGDEGERDFSHRLVLVLPITVRLHIGAMTVRLHACLTDVSMCCTHHFRLQHDAYRARKQNGFIADFLVACDTSSFCSSGPLSTCIELSSSPSPSLSLLYTHTCAFTLSLSLSLTLLRTHTRTVSPHSMFSLSLSILLRVISQTRF